MDIMDIKSNINNTVNLKVHPRSITVLNEDGKTKGVIRGFANQGNVRPGAFFSAMDDIKKKIGRRPANRTNVYMNGMGNEYFYLVHVDIVRFTNGKEERYVKEDVLETAKLLENAGVKVIWYN